MTVGLDTPVNILTPLPDKIPRYDDSTSEQIQTGTVVL
uniref:Uncharacterized protein n=1 Tax=Lepeophtheirus salmonis TaxID=72036 RepID=A0A0K2TJG2_LEPSM